MLRTTTATISSTSTATPPPTQSSTDAHLSLLFEHFGYNPRAYIDSFIYKASECLVSHGEELEASLLTLCKDDGTQAAQATFSLLTLLDKAVDHIADILELYSMQHVFGITQRQAEWMVLPHQEGLELRGTEAEEEARGLDETHRRLSAQLSAARATQSALQLAVLASRRRLAKSRALRTVLVAATTTDIATAARKLDASVISTSSAKPLYHALLTSLQVLRGTDPLGRPLFAAASGRKHESAAEPLDGDSLRPWDKGREGYLKWQTQRYLALAGSSSSTSDAVTAGQKRKSIHAHTAPRKSTALHEDEEGMAGEEVGHTGDMEHLARLLQRADEAL